MTRLLVLVALIPALVSTACGEAKKSTPPPTFTGDPGPYRVGHVSYLVSDAARSNRPVAISVWYPADAAAITAATPGAAYPFYPLKSSTPSSTSAEWEALGYDPAYEQGATSPSAPFPLVVLSPGWNFPSWLHVGLAARLATHGFITAVIDHTGDGNIFGVGATSLQEGMFQRPRDLSFAITELVTRNGTPGALLHGAIDPSRIAVGGHSLGGYAGFALAGGDDSVCDALSAVGADGGAVSTTCAPTLVDTRVGALISIEGSSWGMRFGELARIPVPSLLMGRTVAALATSEGTPYETFLARPHAAIQRPDSYRVDVERTAHATFTNICDSLALGVKYGFYTAGDAALVRSVVPCDGMLSPGEVHQVLTRYLVAFLDVHLKGQTAGAAILTAADAATHSPTVQFIDAEACTATLPDATYFTYRPLQSGGACAVARKDPVAFFAP
jgi:predicted dienelactone hydrolase